MIAPEMVTAWRAQAPWRSVAQVEQDLVLSRALVDLFSRPLVRETCTLRGGTALNKLVLIPPARYSEDIDLVQERPGPIGPLLDEIRSCLDPWLGRARFDTSDRMNTLIWRFQASTEPPIPLRLKVEINSREHGWVGEPIRIPFAVESSWFTGSTEITTVSLADLMATKLRALYQRRKGRDLFDFQVVLQRESDLDLPKVVAGFRTVMERDGRTVSWKELVENMETKLSHRLYAADVPPLLVEGEFDAVEVWAALAPRLQAAWGDA